jgi:hypothetical protein
MAPSLGCFNNTHLGTSDAVSERRPPHHRNPIIEGMDIMTIDRAIGELGARVVW